MNVPTQQSSSKEPRQNELLLVLILAGVQFSHILDFVLMMPLGPQLMRTFSIDVQNFSLLVSVYTFSAAFSCFFAVFFMDLYDRKRVLLFVYSGLVIGTMLCGMATSFQFLLGARLVTGCFGGLLQAIILSVLGDLVPEHRRGQATGIIMAAFAVASVAGVPAGLAIANQFGWNMAFLLLAVFSLINLFFVWLKIPQLRSHIRDQVNATDRGHRFGYILRDFILLLTQGNTLVAIAMIVSMMSVFGLFPFISAFLVQIVGIAEDQLPLIYLVSGVASLITTPIIGRCSDVFGPRRVFVACTVLSMFAVTFFSRLGPSPLWIALALNTLVSAVGTGRMTPSMDLISRSVVPEKRGSFMTLVAAVQQLSASAASYGGGMILGGAAGLSNFALIGVVVASTMIVSIGLSFLFKPMSRTHYAT